MSLSSGRSRTNVTFSSIPERYSLPSSTITTQNGYTRIYNKLYNLILYTQHNTYDSNNNLISITQYKGDQLHGDIKEYDTSKRIKRIEKYNNNTIVYKEEYYYTNDKITEEIKYEGNLSQITLQFLKDFGYEKDEDRYYIESNINDEGTILYLDIELDDIDIIEVIKISIEYIEVINDGLDDIRSRYLLQILKNYVNSIELSSSEKRKIKNLLDDIEDIAEDTNIIITKYWPSGRIKSHGQYREGSYRDDYYIKHGTHKLYKDKLENSLIFEGIFYSDKLTKIITQKVSTFELNKVYDYNISSAYMDIESTTEQLTSTTESEGNQLTSSSEEEIIPIVVEYDEEEEKVPQVEVVEYDEEEEKYIVPAIQVLEDEEEKYIIQRVQGVEYDDEEEKYIVPRDEDEIYSIIRVDEDYEDRYNRIMLEDMKEEMNIKMLRKIFILGLIIMGLIVGYKMIFQRKSMNRCDIPILQKRVG